MMLMHMLRVLVVSMATSPGLLLQVAGGGRREARDSCDSANVQCAATSGCQMALRNFHHFCYSVLFENDSSCSQECAYVIVSLLTTGGDAGRAFYNCDCKGLDSCEDRKRRVEACRPQVEVGMRLAVDERALLSCTFAQWLCEADTSCLMALQFYADNCNKLMAGEKCTARCRNSIDILYRQNSSRKLQSCVCDSTETYDCAQLQHNTQRLCFQREPKISYVTASRGTQGGDSGARGFSGAGSPSRPPGSVLRDVRRRKNRTKWDENQTFSELYFGGRRKRQRRRRRKDRQRASRRRRRKTRKLRRLHRRKRKRGL